MRSSNIACPRFPGVHYMLACACAAACTRPVPPPGEPPGAAPRPEVVVAARPREEAPSPLAAIIGGLVLTSAGGVAIGIEDVGPAVDACEAAGWPAELPVAIAAAVAKTPVGSHAIVVHPAGSTTVTVAGIECQAPGDIEGPIAYLRLVTPPPTGPPDPRASTTTPGLGAREHLAVIGATVAATTRLVDPLPLALGQPQHAARRAMVGTHVTAIAEARGEACQAQWEADEAAARPSAVASTAAVTAAIEGAAVHELHHGEETLLFAVIGHEQITFDCNGGVDTLALLLDARGELLLELETNNGIELDWLVDLDGDGIDEAVVDMTSMEDGMHSKVVLHREGEGWTSTTLWSADTP
jgi:hypothetical protein